MSEITHGDLDKFVAVLLEKGQESLSKIIKGEDPSDPIVDSLISRIGTHAPMLNFVTRSVQLMLNLPEPRLAYLVTLAIILQTGYDLGFAEGERQAMRAMIGGLE